VIMIMMQCWFVELSAQLPNDVNFYCGLHITLPRFMNKLNRILHLN
jgi:hypothetical protein